MLLALAEPAEQFSFRLAWSRWRRRHQAVAKRAHRARRAKRPVVLPPAQPTTRPVRPHGSPELTDDQWQRSGPRADVPTTTTARWWQQCSGSSGPAAPGGPYPATSAPGKASTAASSAGAKRASGRGSWTSSTNPTPSHSLPKCRCSIKGPWQKRRAQARSFTLQGGVPAMTLQGHA